MSDGAALDRMRRLRERVGPGVLVVATGVLLCVVVAAMGAVALGAELLGEWRYYFVMERAMTLSMPVAMALLVATVLTGFAAALWAR